MRNRILLAIALAVLAGVTTVVLRLDDKRPTVVVYTSVDQVFSEPVLRQFEHETGIRVRVVFDTEETKSTGVLNRLVAEGDNPQADVFWSGDPVRPFVLIERGLVEPYRSPQAGHIPSGFKAEDGAWTGFAARARVLLVNKQRIGARPMPSSVRDLADPRWKGDAAIANPLFGTTTMHVAAWFSTWGETEAKTFLNQLKENQVRIASSNGAVKRLVIAGEVAFGLTDIDDAFVALKSGARVEVIYPDQDGLGTLVMPTAVVLLRGGPNAEGGKRVVDFLLSARVETMLARSAAHMPLRADAILPEDLRSLGEIRAMKVNYADVAGQMKRIQAWLRKWVGF